MYDKIFEKRTGWNISWVEMSDLTRATVLLTNGEVDMTVADSADISRLFNRQGRAKLIWVEEGLQTSEGLIVPNRYHFQRRLTDSLGGNIRTPMDLKGKRIGAVLGSTAYYSLISYYKELGAEIITETAYQRLHPCAFNQTDKLIPCHFQNVSEAVTIYGMDIQDIMQAFQDGTIHAAYVGYPYLTQMQAMGGAILLYSDDVARWGKMTFRGLLATIPFLERPGVSEFLKAYLHTMARANFYYKNNTKEFSLYYAGAGSVSAKAAAIVPNGVDTDAYYHMSTHVYPGLKEQVSVRYMGKGIYSRIVYALRDHATVFYALKSDMNKVWGTETDDKISYYDYNSVALGTVLSLEQFAAFIDISYIQLVLDDGVTDAYHLIPGDIVHLGYFIADIHGPTISVLTADNCSLYPSDKYPTSVLTFDIKSLPKCRCREYYIYGLCPGDTGYDPLGYGLEQTTGKLSKYRL